MKLVTTLAAVAVLATATPIVSAPAQAREWGHHHRAKYKTVCRKVRYHHHWVKRCHRVRAWR